MFQTSEANDDALRLTRAAAREKDIKRVVSLQAVGGSARLRGGELCGLLRREDQGCTRNCHDRVDGHVRSARFHRAKERDQHFWFAMPERCDRPAIIAETLC